MFRSKTRRGYKNGKATERLSMTKPTREYWIKVDKRGKLDEIGKSQRPVGEREVELVGIKRES